MALWASAVSARGLLQLLFAQLSALLLVLCIGLWGNAGFLFLFIIAQVSLPLGPLALWCRCPLYRLEIQRDGLRWHRRGSRSWRSARSLFQLLLA